SDRLTTNKKGPSNDEPLFVWWAVLDGFEPDLRQPLTPMGRRRCAPASKPLKRSLSKWFSSQTG
ncbi:hypothetical protein, partial [Aequoribacter sp.]|uniref:hypothetical protein n=1 Tax=Aequoribacter sp. TaxID=2847771 RepID=UPI003F69CB51